ncbi:glycosyltransferase family 4 protein [Elizabethkingia occulta]|uniref:glycosyltransferase family 4 protein n=1 Tax=Elizabethkingia occulta TaxID=1867263 RepID=UPI00398C7CA2
MQKSGGGSVYWTELIKRFNDNGKIESVFYDQKEPNENIFRKGISLKNIQNENFLWLKIRRYLNFTVPIKEKSIFHSSYFRISSSPKAINVTSIHDFTTERFRTGLAKWINLQQKKHAVRNSAGVVCISENTKKDLLHFIPDLNPTKVRVIYNGVSDDFFFIDNDFDISEKEGRFSVLENFQYVLYIGHRTNYKNFPIAVEVAVKFKDKYKLVIVGEPFTEEEKVFVESKLDDNYLILSKLRNKELNFLYNKAFALLYPSSYEGFGIPIVEAMKTHCPVIATYNSSIPEVAGDAAILCKNTSVEEFTKSMKSLENKNFRDNLIEKGIEQSEKFNWDKTCQDYLDFYEELYNKI